MNNQNENEQLKVINIVVCTFNHEKQSLFVEVNNVMGLTEETIKKVQNLGVQFLNRISPLLLQFHSVNNIPLFMFGVNDDTDDILFSSEYIPFLHDSSVMRPLVEEVLVDIKKDFVENDKKQQE